MELSNRGRARKEGHVAMHSFSCRKIEKVSLLKLTVSWEVETQFPQQAQVPLILRFSMDVAWMKFSMEANASFSEIGRSRSWRGQRPSASLSISKIPNTRLEIESKFHTVCVHPGIIPHAVICCCLLNMEWRRSLTSCLI